MAGTGILEALRRELDANPHLTSDGIEALQADSDTERSAGGFMLAATWHYRNGDYARALAVLDAAKMRFTPPPIAMLHMRTELRRLMGDDDLVALDYLDHGCVALDHGLHDLGLEAVGTALTADIVKGYHRILHDPVLTLGVTDRYEKIAAGISVPPRRDSTAPHDRLRVGMIVPGLVDHTVAYSNRVLFFSRFMDTSRFELHVYVTENAVLSSYQLPITPINLPSVQRAPQYLKELKERGVPVFIAPLALGIRERAALVAERISEDGIDILILQAGPASPVDWLATRIAPVPVKLQIHIGASAFQRGIAATLFDNAVNMEREREQWPDYVGRQVLMRRGTDIERLDGVVPVPRSKLGLPDDAVLVGTLSNHLDLRLSDTCIAAICAAMKSPPHSWYVGIGGDGKSGRIMDLFAKHGLSDRVRLLPGSRDPAPILKTLDIYANEFPSGGSQSVVEAMACGIPVVALRAGNTHHESVGADIVGKPYAVENNDPAAYRALLERWLNDPAARSEAGKAMRKRAEDEFSIRKYVRAVCELGKSIYERAT